MAKLSARRRQEIEEAIEDMVDEASMVEIVRILSDIAAWKAHHLEEAWQAGDVAKDYYKASKALDACADKLKKLPMLDL